MVELSIPTTHPFTHSLPTLLPIVTNTLLYPINLLLPLILDNLRGDNARRALLLRLQAQVRSVLNSTRTTLQQRILLRVFFGGRIAFVGARGTIMRTVYGNCIDDLVGGEFSIYNRWKLAKGKYTKGASPHHHHPDSM